MRAMEIVRGQTKVRRTWPQGLAPIVGVRKKLIDDSCKYGYFLRKKIIDFAHPSRSVSSQPDQK